MAGNFSKKLIEKLQKKTQKKLDPKQLESLAGKLDKSDLQNEESLSKLIRQLSLLANVDISKEQEEKIISYLKKNNIQDADMKTLFTLLNKKLD
jgi:hypothetical protein